MMPNFALLLATLVSSAVASVIDVALHIIPSKEESSSDQHELYKRRGGGQGGSQGRGLQPSFCGGQYYPGGSTTSYNAGAASPGGITPYMIDGAALTFWPGTWLYGAYVYLYNHAHQYYNGTSNKGEECCLLCGCSRYERCACDHNNSIQYSTRVNGFVAILIGETLSNNTDLPDDKASGSATTRRIVGTSHYVIVTVTVIAAAFVAWRESGLTQKLCKGQHLRSLFVLS
ncbi:hypothetical protein BFJ66_g15156 [Fusarium oxysporum f. sp. cepae]|uniref:DUF7732 domain-containing protein n=1 Tax=Fusarium oxysporum f. sp. cepae TaxID=396571 RepID=A0A3L6N0T5_FUSOX|nr:hypothetical protein BFJ65_g14556 [Fusarium oxysporum f. sp. cepae]RKK32941.1 hypothetical protein BFJ66_g15156 [Fusarium oxysporum f. sp. cepae]